MGEFLCDFGKLKKNSMVLEKMDSAEKITEGKSFIKRRTSLIKKASELAILCGSEVAIIGYSNDGELFEYASSEYALICFFLYIYTHTHTRFLA